MTNSTNTGLASGPVQGSKSVSILLLTKNGRSDLERSLVRIEQQVYSGPIEFICIDSGSTDGTVEFLRERGFEPYCIPPDAFHHGRTRNLAASRARNEILVSLSQDAVPSNESWLVHLTAPFGDPDVGAVYGRQVGPANVGLVRRRSLEYEYPATRQVRHIVGDTTISPGLFRFSNANAAVRREVWARFQWNESILVSEDQGMCRDILMAGMKVVYEPEAEVVHGHERSMLGEFRFAVDNGISLTRLGILNNPRIGGEFRYGIERMTANVRSFLSIHQYGCACQALLISVAKWIGVSVGKREARLPGWVFRYISETHARMQGN